MNADKAGAAVVQRSVGRSVLIYQKKRNEIVYGIHWKEGMIKLTETLRWIGICKTYLWGGGLFFFPLLRDHNSLDPVTRVGGGFFSSSRR